MRGSRQPIRPAASAVHRPASQQVRFLFLATDFPPARGGIQTFSHELPRALVCKGHQVAVAALAAPGAAAGDASLPFPVVRRSAPCGKLGAIVALRRGCPAAARELAGPPDWLVAMKWMPEGPAAVLARRKLGCRLALVGHGREFLPSDSRPIKRPVQRWVLRAADVALANSHYTAGNVVASGVPGERVRTIYCGVRPERYEVDEGRVQALRERLGLAGKQVLLTAGRLVARKGHDVVIRALPQVLAQVPDVHYLMVGGGPEEDRLRSLARRHGVEDAVTICPDVPDEDMPSFFHLCDMFVMPSRDIPGAPIEGFGIVYLEAAACAKPCVAGWSGGSPEAVRDGVTGLLVDPTDAEELCRAVLRLLSDPHAAARLGAAGRQRVLDRFTWSHVADRFLAAL